MDEKIRLIKEPITRAELQAIATERYGDMVKAVVDVASGVMALGGEMHADEESFLLEKGSEQENLWGINLYPERAGADFVEFDSMINIRPRQGNRSRGIESKSVQDEIKKTIQKLVKDI